MCTFALLSLMSNFAIASGPIERPCPEATAVAKDAAQLRALLTTDESDIWIAGRIVGDFEVLRTVRLHGCGSAELEGTGRGTVLRIKGENSVVEDLRIRKSGTRVSTEDGGLKVTGAGSVVRRVEVTDTLFGISLEACKACVLEDSRVFGRKDIEENMRGDGIKLWEAHHAVVRKNYVEGVRDSVVWYSSNVTLEDNVFIGGRYGTHFMYSHDSSVRRTKMRDNVVGVFVMYSARLMVEDNELSGAKGAAGMGIGFKESDAVTLKGNFIVANTTGVYFDQTPRDPKKPVVFEKNSVALNAVGLKMSSGQHGATFYQNDFLSNDVVVEVGGNGDARDLTFKNNHWDGYAGYDLDRDGVGDVAFLLKRHSTNIRDAHPSLRYFQGTPAMALYDGVAQALPFLASKVLLEDLSPSVRQHREIPR